MKVLVVDDSMTIRFQVKTALQGGGFEVAEAGDGVLALAALRAGGVSAVVCDINMPNMGGIELLEQAAELARTIPFVMLTTEGQATLMQRAKALGARAWLVKPCRPDLLVATLKKLTGT